MSAERATDPPLLQRVYDRIWLLAAAAFVFFMTVYVAWGLIDVLTVPTG